MATDQPTIPLGIDALNFAASQFHDQADKFRVAADARNTLAANLALAARICDRLASLRFEVAEIAAKTADPTAARDLRAALEDAARGA
jgi:hypothetical protein